MKNIFIIHGAYGSPKENWIPWLRKELEKEGREVITPKFPTPKGQNLKNWLNIFKKYENKIGEGTILVGHSIGATFLLSLLEKLQSPIAATFLVSGFTGPLCLPEFDKINQSFAEKEFDWQKIRANSPLFFIIHGDNDPYVSKEKAQELAKKLKTKIDFIKNGGHLNKEAGFTKFKYLKDAILDIGA